ncbi:unnamed protein product [Didymodactylos carnosus]|uniref:Uncharacterized protein n=1 Tax=Didymodactylos carnosus TaxID=1234261 RepID=A0A814H0N1_9BILA|nr:unnamed protein product [Didymodactylos carnosus]CAF1039362.1 unnamed protein product [Didymodactylos carnosus]CAF3774621.1 unnamed protein product [Didymodactylos carnosus]CAF3807527.1 unnamed protein product [Didymodactylos carnosus]
MKTSVQVKQEPSNTELQTYAQETVNELLRIYGYNIPSNRDQLPAKKINNDPTSLVQQGDVDKSIDRLSTSSSESSNLEPIKSEEKCVWCQKLGGRSFTLKIDNEIKSLCSEVADVDFVVNSNARSSENCGLESEERQCEKRHTRRFQYHGVKFSESNKAPMSAKNKANRRKLLVPLRRSTITRKNSMDNEYGENSIKKVSHIDRSIRHKQSTRNEKMSSKSEVISSISTENLSSQNRSLCTTDPRKPSLHLPIHLPWSTIRTPPGWSVRPSITDFPRLMQFPFDASNTTSQLSLQDPNSRTSLLKIPRFADLHMTPTTQQETTKRTVDESNLDLSWMKKAKKPRSLSVTDNISLVDNIQSSNSNVISNAVDTSSINNYCASIQQNQKKESNDSPNLFLSLFNSKCSFSCIIPFFIPIPIVIPVFIPVPDWKSSTQSNVSTKPINSLASRVHERLNNLSPTDLTSSISKRRRSLSCLSDIDYQYNATKDDFYPVSQRRANQRSYASMASPNSNVISSQKKKE